MSDGTLIAVVTLIVGATQMISLAAIKAWTDKNHIASEKAKTEISDELKIVHRDVNGKMDKMQEAIRTGALAEGNLLGRAQLRQERQDNESGLRREDKSNVD